MYYIHYRIEKEPESLAKLKEKFPDLYENGFIYKSKKQRFKNKIQEKDGAKTPDSYFSSANNSESESENNHILSRVSSLENLDQISFNNNEEHKSKSETILNLPSRDFYK